MRRIAAVMMVALACGCATAHKESGLARVDNDGDLDIATAAAPQAMMKSGAPAPSPVADAPGGGSGSSIVKPTEGRRIVYTAMIGLRVASARATAAEVEKLATAAGGFIQNSSLEAVTLRVPPAKFDGLLASLEQLGEVIQRSVDASDVTEQYTDLELRLDVAERSRQRLNALLESAKETKDLLEIERDLRRLTEEIEQMKGTRRVLDDRIGWATVTVSLQERTVVQPAGARTSPFPWLRQVGIDRTMREMPGAHMGTGLVGPAFRLADGDPAPAGFVPLAYHRNELVAATATDYRLRVWHGDTPVNSTLDFWAKSLRQELTQSRGYTLENESDFPLDHKGLVAKRLSTTVAFAGEQWAYDVWIATESGAPDHEIYIVEYARLQRDKDVNMAEVEAAVRGLKARGAFGL